jgi:hypothetical protein
VDVFGTDIERLVARAQCCLSYHLVPSSLRQLTVCLFTTIVFKKNLKLIEMSAPGLSNISTKPVELSVILNYITEK